MPLFLPLPLPLGATVACLMRSLLDNCICHATFAVRCTCVCVCVYCIRIPFCIVIRIVIRCLLPFFILHCALLSFPFPLPSPLPAACFILWLSLGATNLPAPPPPSLAAALFHLILVHFNCLLSCAFALRSASFAAASLSLISQGRSAGRVDIIYATRRARDKFLSFAIFRLRCIWSK